MKACILKSIVWNANNWISPSGHPSSSGYTREYGYGAEEWNNNPAWVWRGFKIFHTEAQEKLFSYSNKGNLGILMISSNKNNQYALGLATNVYDIDDKERDLIVDELNIYDYWRELWELNKVKRCFNNNRANFLNHWREDCNFIGKWKCSKDNYFWFETPILLEPLNITGKSRLSVMHSRYQGIEPEKIIEIINDHINHDSAIWDWLTTGEFDKNIIPKNRRKNFKTSQEIREKYKQLISPSTANNEFEYWVKGKKIVEPLHAVLQSKFVRYLREKGIKYKENINYIDVQYKFKNKVWFCEIKPTKKVDTKYAIRLAIGQLLEYRFKHNKQALLNIIIGDKPKPKEIKFAGYLDITLTYYDKNKDTFISINPKRRT